MILKLKVHNYWKYLLKFNVKIEKSTINIILKKSNIYLNYFQLKTFKIIILNMKIKKKFYWLFKIKEF